MKTMLLVLLNVCMLAGVFAADKPNIVVYITDDQDKYNYGCYGNDKINTPAVDRLAREGVLFENAFTGQAICAPSRSQMYTGKYPLKNGCFLNHIQVKKDQLSVTKYMRDLGYEVILAGKSHVKPASVFDWDQEWPSIDKKGFPRPYIPLDQIQDYFKNADKPVCMFITSSYPHGPHFDLKTKTSDAFKFYPFNEKEKDSNSLLEKLTGYYRSVEEDNLQLEKVLQWVDEYLGENTLFIYSSDHGTSGKFTVYDRGLNVPFVARWPGVIQAGRRSNVMIHYTDVLPTFIEMADGAIPADMDGKSFLPVLRGSEREIHDYVYGVQTNQNIINAKVFPSRMIRSNQYKYIRNFNSVEVMEQNFGDNQYVNEFIRIGAMKYKDTPLEELYDIKNDPYEQVNLAKDPALRTIKEGLAADMFKWMKAQGDILSDKPGYMPILKANFKLDETTPRHKVPKELEGTLKAKDYLVLHY